MSLRSKLPVVALVTRLLGRLRFPQLFVLTAVLFALNLVIPDVIPALDEIMLGLLGLLLAKLKTQSEAPDGDLGSGFDDAHARKPPPKNVTPDDPAG